VSRHNRKDRKRVLRASVRVSIPDARSLLSGAGPSFEFSPAIRAWISGAQRQQALDVSVENTRAPERKRGLRSRCRVLSAPTQSGLLNLTERKVQPQLMTDAVIIGLSLAQGALKLLDQNSAGGRGGGP
jgi:hypothetical protein